LSKPTAFRILATLVADGLAVQNEPNASYCLGVVPLQLATAVLRDIPIREQARPVMQAISDRVHETVVLSVRQADSRFNIDSFEAMNAIGQTQQLGIAIPLYAGAASRVLLAGLEDAEIDDYLARTTLVAYSDTTLVDPDKLRAEIARIRLEGHAISSAEFTPGGHAVACPILGPDGRPVAALHVSIPRSRAAPDLIDRCIEQLKLGAEAIRSVLT
jgi:DNA-binding IclR family transcriptional regulator